MNKAERIKVEYEIERLLKDRIAACVFWDGDDFALDDSLVERLSTDVVDEFFKARNLVKGNLK